MRYQSTRGGSENGTFREVVLRGISADGQRTDRFLDCPELLL
jgi:hypothetical protein